MVAYPKVISLSLSYQRLVEPLFATRQINEALSGSKLLKLAITNSELDFSIVPFLTQQRGCLKELVLTGNTFYDFE